MGCKSKYRDTGVLDSKWVARLSSQGRALELTGDRKPREMTVAPQGVQNPAYTPGSPHNREPLPRAPVFLHPLVVKEKEKVLLLRYHGKIRQKHEI